MELPVINLPKIDLPFDIPTLLHPAVVHFAIVLPVVILLLEFYNLFMKRKSIGVFSFILIVLTVVILVAAYFTGNVDGKEAYNLLSGDGKAELKAHKLLGVYLLLASLVVLVFKFLAMTGKRLLRVIYFMTLIGLILITFQQGKDGGELVYEYGSNVKPIKALDDKFFDLQEELSEAEEEVSELEEKAESRKQENMKVEAPLVTQTIEAIEPFTPTLVEPEQVENNIEANATL